MRRDLRRNIESLLLAAEDLVREGQALTMTAIAERAGVAASTAWRHFSSVDDLMSAYTTKHIEELRTFVVGHTREPELLRKTLHAWVHIVLDRGHALADFRSRLGYLRRLHDGDSIIVAASEAWTPGLLQCLDSAGLSQSALEISLYLTNSLTDPREIRDLHENAHLTSEEIALKLERVIRGAVGSWIDG